jgi:hypothetical protein
VREPPVPRVARQPAHAIESSPQQTILGSVGIEDVVLDLELVRASGGLSQLAHHIEPTTQKPLLLLHRVVVKADAALDQPLELVEELPHHPFRERGVEGLNVGGRRFPRGQIETAFEHAPQQLPGCRGVVRVVGTLGRISTRVPHGVSITPT